jgi:ketosteroid isomerase-like protein
MRVRWMVLIALLLAACALAARAEDLSPEETVRQYLAAFQANDFKAAYPLVTADMSQHKSREDWAKEQQWVMQMAEVKIFDFHVYPGKIEGDKAYVPNLLSSQDKFLNQLGVVEHELYTLRREDGRWKIDQQQIVEPTDVAKWFPDSGTAAEKKK